MEISEIYPPYIYSIRYDAELEDEYTRLFREWNDIELVSQFMEDNIECLKSPVWERVRQPEEATDQVLNEAAALEDLFELLNSNANHGIKPDFDSFFCSLDGKYKYVHELHPMKSYGPIRPSLIRICHKNGAKHLSYNRWWNKVGTYNSKFAGAQRPCYSKH